MRCQSEEETSSGGDPLVSNKIGCLYEKRGWTFGCSTLTFFGKPMALKTHLSLDK